MGKEVSCIITARYVSRNKSTVLSLQLAEMACLLTGTVPYYPGTRSADGLQTEHTDCYWVPAPCARHKQGGWKIPTSQTYKCSFNQAKRR